MRRGHALDGVTSGALDKVAFMDEVGAEKVEAKSLGPSVQRIVLAASSRFISTPPTLPSLSCSGATWRLLQGFVFQFARYL